MPGCRRGRRVRPRPDRRCRSGDPDRYRRGPDSRRIAEDAGTGGAGVRGDVPGPASAPRGGLGDGLRTRPRRVRAGQGHRGLELLRAPSGALHRGGPRRLHPESRRPDHRPEQAGPTGRSLRQAAAGPGAVDHPDRRCAGKDARAARRDRGDRMRAPLHDHAWRPQARLQDHHQRGPRPVAQRRHARRSDATNNVSSSVRSRNALPSQPATSLARRKSVSCSTRPPPERARVTRRSRTASSACRRTGVPPFDRLRARQRVRLQPTGAKRTPVSARISGWPSRCCSGRSRRC